VSAKRRLKKGVTSIVWALACAAGPSPGHAAGRIIVYAWSRPEDLRFLDADATIAAQTGFVVLSGSGLSAWGRRFPLLVRPGQVTTAVVHVEIDRKTPLRWSPDLRRRAAQAVLRLARTQGLANVQIDFEVRQSERPVLLDLLGDVRRGLGPGVRLSMTAQAAWCSQGWLGQAPVDEIVPMLFRMGPDAPAIKARLAAGGDFAEPACRQALAISTDAPIGQAPARRAVYVFDPRRWTPQTYERVRRQVAAWGEGGIMVKPH
jgi:hypothetical protein